MRQNRSYCRVLCWMLALVVLLALGAGLDTIGRAEDAPDPEPAADAKPASDEPAEKRDGEEQETEVSDTFGMLVVKSGWFSIVFYVLLFIFSMVAFMVALERLSNLAREKIMPTQFVSALGDLARRDNSTAEDFRQLSTSSDTPLARILQGGVARAGRPLPEVEKSMEDAAAREMAELRSRNRPLSTVGNIAPLVGLLGTVVGMIFAFSTASEVGLGRADELAKGIYLALITTAAGLTIAIPSLLTATWFNGKVERFMREMDKCLLEAMPCFARFENLIIAERISTDQLAASSSPALETAGEVS